MSVDQTLVNDALAELSFPVSEEEAVLLKRYLDGMLLWNRAYNLTAITDPAEMVIKHLLDSLVLKPHLEARRKDGRFIDVGSGAGLPGIPLAIVMPDASFTLLDSNNKRTRFITQMVMELGLKNVEVIHSRVQDYLPETGFDLVLSRAFASAADFTNWSSHLLAENGAFAAMKGRFDEAEWGEIDPAWQSEVIALSVPKLNEARHLVLLSRQDS
ncbi:MAG: 16S rRNA (guanine(527)-N(7))-methyltransferase RsmG [Xanthomonadaceae bacterium]|nr:16S rRNA (guanine(527)-N(7))-methyltransferase RsmG [Xanthomonadaceae bacterium]